MTNTKNTIWRSEYFCGNKVSTRGICLGYVDYATLAKSFDAVLNNDIISKTSAAGIGYWECVNGNEYDEETNDYAQIYQYFIISDKGASILQDYTNEIVYYNETLDMYIWGVTHYGTNWDCVMTDIKIVKE